MACCIWVSIGPFKDLNIHHSMLEYTTFEHNIILPSLPAVNSCCMLSHMQAVHIKLCKHENMHAHMQALRQICTQSHTVTHIHIPHLPPASCQFWHHCLFPGIHWRRGGLWIHMWLPSEAVAQQRCPLQGCAPQTQPIHSSAAPPVKACTSLCSPGCTVTAAPPSEWHGNTDKDGVSLTWLAASQFTVGNDTVV